MSSQPQISRAASPLNTANSLHNQRSGVALRRTVPPDRYDQRMISRLGGWCAAMLLLGAVLTGCGGGGSPSGHAASTHTTSPNGATGATSSGTASATKPHGGSLLPESSTAGEVALAYAHAYATKNFELACEYDPQLKEETAQKGVTCSQYLRENDEKQEKGEAQGVVPESLPEFARATVKSEVAKPEGDDEVTLKADTPQAGAPSEVVILVRRTNGNSGPWRVEA